MIYCFVEGPDDETFFKKLFLRGSDPSEFLMYPYAQKKKQDVNNFIKTLEQRQCDYVFFVDSDGKQTDKRIEEFTTRYPALRREKLFVVHYEIESWYLAGLSQQNAIKIGITKYIPNTDDVTKENFNKLIEKCKDTRLQILLNIMEVYESSLADDRNNSFLNFHKTRRALCI